MTFADPAVTLESTPVAAFLDFSVLLPSQVSPRSDERPELRLFQSVLETAIEDLADEEPSGARHAFLWLEDDHMDWPVSFRRTCETLDFDFVKVRSFAREVYAKRIAYRRRPRHGGRRKPDRRLAHYSENNNRPS